MENVVEVLKVMSRNKRDMKPKQGIESRKEIWTPYYGARMRYGEREGNGYYP